MLLHNTLGPLEKYEVASYGYDANLQYAVRRLATETLCVLSEAPAD